MKSTKSSSPHTFSKRYRLSLQRDFRHVFRNGRRFDSEWAVFLASPNGLDHGRLGIVVRRRLGNSVRRNRMKRQIREWFRHSGKDHPLDWVVIPKPGLSVLETPRRIRLAFGKLLAPLLNVP
ncbi:MAG: ribonuclease P protein component [Nitrospirae bacterium]|nr:ribonuclease P protein component [Nitrospirota bacterium]